MLDWLKCKFRRRAAEGSKDQTTNQWDVLMNQQVCYCWFTQCVYAAVGELKYLNRTHLQLCKSRGKFNNKKFHENAQFLFGFCGNTLFFKGDFKVLSSLSSKKNGFKHHFTKAKTAAFIYNGEHEHTKLNTVFPLKVCVILFRCVHSRWVVCWWAWLISQSGLLDRIQPWLAD